MDSTDVPVSWRLEVTQPKCAVRECVQGLAASTLFKMRMSSRSSNLRNNKSFVRFPHVFTVFICMHTSNDLSKCVKVQCGSEGHLMLCIQNSLRILEPELNTNMDEN